MKSLLYLSRQDVIRVNLTLSEVIDILRCAFREKGEGRLEMPPKPGIHPRADAFLHAMPAFLPGLGIAGLKWVGGFPQNLERGLPYISGLLVLNDVMTGLPLAVMDCTWITAYRTAAATALSATYLARPESSVVAILACGWQGRTHLEALAGLFPIGRAYAYDLQANVQAAFVKEMSDQLGIEVVGVAEPRLAVQASHIVVTSGPILKSPRPTIESDWVQPGTFASAVDFDSYWTPGALQSFDRLATDDHAQFEYYQRAGYFRETPRPYADLGELTTGQKSGRQNDQERTMAINLGVALEDIAVAARIYELARQRGLGHWLEL